MSKIFAKAYLEEGKAYVNENRLIPAINSFTKALRFSDDKKIAFECYFERGICNYDLENLAEAQEDFLQAIMLNSSDFRPYHQLAACFSRMRKFDLSIKNLTEAMQRAKDEKNKAILYLDRARAYEDLDMFAMAESDFNKAVFFAPDDHEILFERADFYFWFGKFYFAIRDIEKAIKMKPLLKYITKRKEIICFQFNMDFPVFH
jgi:tetratricopeptide (TPR) repeat protein